MIAVAPATVEVADTAASAQVRQFTAWVMDSHDNGDRPFVIVDKRQARVFVFDAGGHLRGADAALLGMARGDGSASGIGKRKLSGIGPRDRTTPAGRFVANLDRDLHGGEILLVDYADAIALHPVVKGTPAEHRAERLASATVEDNRISYGCINVPAQFYRTIVRPAFANTDGLVYILPETRTMTDVFGSRVVDDPARKPIPPGR